MELRLRLTLSRILLGLSATLVLLVIILLLFAFSGVYSVAASTGHLSWVKQLLAFGMQRSVATWSMAVTKPPQDLDSTARVKLGAGHFFGGCANCHGAPGAQVNAVHERMLPPPPRLAGHIENWTEKQLFWIARNGIKYTGMPFWSGEDRDDEVWSVVAFLRQLPDLDPDSYQQLVHGNAPPADIPAAQLVASGNASTHLTACDRCHDTATAGPTSALIPRLGGQSGDYIARSLREYLKDQRQSGIMEPIAVELDERQIAKLATHYSTLTSPRHADVPTPDNARVERGRQLAEQGDATRGIPPCKVCHSAGALSAYPLLAAQPAAYTEAQLNVWLEGGRAQSALGALMADIGRRLEPQQIRDVAAYYQTLPTPPAAGDMQP